MSETDIFAYAQHVGEQMEASGDSAEGRLNVYACTPMPMSNMKSGCGHWIVTIDRAAGVTPMFTRCGHCGGTATSRMYKVEPGLEPTHEWFRPKSVSELPNNYSLASVTQHLANGGLLLRPVPGKKDKWIKPTPEIQAFIKDEQKRIKALMGAGN
jgi:hypothetical protein